MTEEEHQWLDAAHGQAIAHFDQAMVDFDIRSPRLSLSADGSTVAVWAQGNARNRISIFHLDATARKVTPQAEGLGNGGSMVGAALSPDGKLIVVGGFFTGSLFVYETATRRRIATHRWRIHRPSGRSRSLRTVWIWRRRMPKGMIQDLGRCHKLTSESKAHPNVEGPCRGNHQGRLLEHGQSACQRESGWDRPTLELSEPSRSGPGGCRRAPPPRYSSQADHRHGGRQPRDHLGCRLGPTTAKPRRR